MANTDPSQGDDFWSEEEKQQSIACGAARPITAADAAAIEKGMLTSNDLVQDPHEGHTAFELRKARAEIERLQSDVTRQMIIATEHVNEVERLRSVIRKANERFNDGEAMEAAVLIAQAAEALQ